MSGAKVKTLVVQPEAHEWVQLAAIAHRTNLQEMTHRLLLAGIERLAPEVLETPHNARSNITPQQFQEAYRGEEEAISEPSLRRTRPSRR